MKKDKKIKLLMLHKNQGFKLTYFLSLNIISREFASVANGKVKVKYAKNF